MKIDINLKIKKGESISFIGKFLYNYFKVDIINNYLLFNLLF